MRMTSDPALLERSADGAQDRIIQLARYWPYQLTVLADRIARHTSAVAREHGDLNLSQWRVLAALAEKPGRTAVEVVTITPMDKGIVSRATKALLEAGLVVRQASQDDGRVSHLFLTDKGQALYQDLVPRIESVPLDASAALSEQEQEMLRDLLARLMREVPDAR